MVLVDWKNYPRSAQPSANDIRNALRSLVDDEVQQVIFLSPNRFSRNTVKTIHRILGSSGLPREIADRVRKNLMVGSPHNSCVLGRFLDALP